MRDSERSGTPFGRPPVAGIPVPPFATSDEFNNFHIYLQLYLATLDEGDVTPATMTLLAVIERSRKQGIREEWKHPEPHVLNIAVTTYFPAPWTPLGIHRELLTTGVGFGTYTVPWHVINPERDFHENSLVWGSDPIFSAFRDDDGRWTVTKSERGVDRVELSSASDDDMVLYRQSFEHVFAAPFGWRYNPLAVQNLEPAADALRSAWADHSTYPYISSWNERAKNRAADN
jgi:hypothetical protein